MKYIYLNQKKNIIIYKTNMKIQKKNKIIYYPLNRKMRRIKMNIIIKKKLQKKITFKKKNKLPYKMNKKI